MALAGDITGATGGDAGRLVEELRSVLATALARNGGKAFGACRTCRHFRSRLHKGTDTPHHCSLLDAALSEADSRAICIEQVDAAVSASDASS
jgi:hypothetical protein